MSILTDKQIFDAIRERRGSALSQAHVDTINAIMYPTAIPPEIGDDVRLAWGARVSPEFRSKVRVIAAGLGVNPSDLMTCMAWETGRTFNPAEKNKAGSGATGLIQFMPATAQGLGTTTAALAAMTAVQQLDWVEKYFRPFKGKLRDLADLYMAILWPKAVGRPLEYVLWDKATRPTTYRQNAGLDTNRDDTITKAECAAKLFAMKAEGLKAGNVG